MTRDQLRQALEREVDLWAARTWAELRTLDAAAWDAATREVDGVQFEVTPVENTDEYVQIVISADDGGLSAFVPVTTSVIVHRDGRVER